MTHFNKGPSYGLSAEVKNKVRAPAGQWGVGGGPAARVRLQAPRRVVEAAGEMRAPQLAEPSGTR